jgi:oxygen-independent coproporphyrinogen-3 oxidase
MVGIYLHIPFCQKKCFYCDFYSITGSSMQDDYVKAIIQEIRLTALDFKDGIPKVDTVFFGGGTPSLLKDEMLENISNELKTHFEIQANTEWTIECNPGTLTLDKLKKYKEIGFNRLSIGVQSFNDKELKFLRRIHNAQTAKDTLENAHKAGFDNISLDLMFSIPGQTVASLEQSLSTAFSYSPKNISAYSLIYEPGTKLFDALKIGKVKQLDDDEDAAQYDYIIDRLTNAGYEQYEVSNFALPGGRSLHNMRYWMSEHYYAFGPSAHGFIGNSRYWNVRDITQYIKLIKKGSLPIEGKEKLTKEKLFEERVFLELRADGIRLDKIKEDFGIDLASANSHLTGILQKEKLIEFKGNRLRLTSKGYMICDSITVQLLNQLKKI